MTNYSKRFGRQLLVMAAVLLGAALFLMTLTPPQEAHGQENNKNEPALSQQEEQEDKKQTKKQTAQSEEKTAQNGPQQETDEPDESNNDQKERVLDEDPQGNEYVAGELLVTYKKGAFKQAKDEAPRKVGARVEKDFPEIEVQHLSLPEVKNEKAQEARQKALERKKQDLEQHPDVEDVDYNHVLEGDWVPNDPSYGKQWGYPKINAPGAWDTTQGSISVKVAVLDTGIDPNHPELRGKVVSQKDFVNDDENASADHPHGTHVAGTVAATTNNNAGVAGTCPNCSLLIAKVLDRNNMGYTSDLIEGINWASSKGANVINMSLGGFPSSTALQQAIDSAWNRGAVLVASAGNDGTNGTQRFPAAYNNVIAVGATDTNDARATWDDPNTTDRVEGSNAGNWVDVAAPGKGIYSTTGSFYWHWTQAYVGTYASWDGTSMAAPHVSGLAGLIFSKGGFMVDNAHVRNRIESTAKDLGTTGRDDVFGHGRINAQAALPSPQHA
jgi:thermitase